MNIWSVNRIMDRLNVMMDHAIAGEPIEDSFDETKMSALETKLAQYLKMNQLRKEQLQKEKDRIDELISDISHQTKTPLANILLYSELLAEAVSDEKSGEMVSAIHTQGEKLSFLIQSLVKTSRLENGLIQTIPEKNLVCELIENVVLQVEKKASQKDIGIEISPITSQAFFDMKWTTEAVGNILDNAVKYTGEGGRIGIAVREYPLFVRIDIKDNGIGIAESDLPKIFGRFYKCTTTRQEEGVGLGLYLAREIISGQGGYIKVKSQENKETVFSVFLRSVV